MKDREIPEIIKFAELKAGEMILHAENIMAENRTDSRNIVTEYDRTVRDSIHHDIQIYL